MSREFNRVARSCAESLSRSKGNLHFFRKLRLSRPGWVLVILVLSLIRAANGQAPLTISCVPITGPSQVGVAYSATCTASGGTAPYSWSISVGSLPPGIALSGTTGTSVTISGTPTTAGVYAYTVQVTDSSIPPQIALQAYAGVILPAAPVISSISPTSATATQPGFTLTVNGSGFTGTSAVEWNAIGLATTFVSASQLTAAVPASLVASPGTAQVTVVSGSLTSNAVTFTVLPPPAITSISPTTTAAGGPAFTLTVNGSGFASDSVVQWNATALTTTVVNTGQVTASVPANLIAIAGVASITVISGGVTSNPVNFTVTPNLTSLSPSSATAGGPAFTLTVNGAGFAAGAVVQWNGSALATTGVSSTRLTAPVLANLIAVAGSAQVTVVSNGVTSNALTFTVLPPPVITSLSPNSATAGGPAFTLTVNGSNFISNSVIDWNGAALSTTFVSASRLTASVPANLIASVGTAQVTVVSDSVGSNALVFTIVAAPTISTISPSTALAGGPAFTLTVTGAGFTSGSVVHWNSTTLSTTFVGATVLTAAVPASLIAIPGTAQITVVSGGVTSNSVSFVVTAAPAITSIVPTTVTAGSGGFTLTVNGTGFAPGAVVNWNGAPLATSFINATQLTAPVLANLIAVVGSARITVTSAGATSNAVTLNIVPGPALATLTPSTATAGGPAFTLTVNGSGFASGATALWNGVALVTTFVSATQLTAAVPASLIATVGSAQVTVSSGGAVSNPLTFSVVIGPTISSLTPSSVVGGGPAFNLTVNGDGFTAGSVVQWNGAALATAVVSPIQLTAAVPANLIASFGSATISVVAGGVQSNAVPISIGVPAITLTGVQSTSVPTQQLNVGIQLASATPAALQGTLQLSFAPNAAGLPAGYMDPAMQFAGGGTTLNFTVPAGASTASPLTGGTIQQGTVAGTVTVTLTSLTAGGVNVMPPTPVTASATILPIAPVITANSVKITNLTATGFNVVLTGYSTPRDVTTATFTFTASAGTQFTGNTTFSVSVASAFSTWYQSQQGQSNGSMFQLQVPFTISGDVSALQSVSVTLTNSVGTSAPVSGGP